MIRRCLVIIGLISIMTGCVFVKMDLKPKEALEEQFVTGNEASKDKILLVPIQGVIFGDEENLPRTVSSPQQIKEILNKAIKDKQIKALILEIDSPGGGVTASDMIYNQIKEFKKAHPDMPIVTIMKDTAASGAYYISMASDYIVAHPTSITGSIGVISIFVTLQDVLNWAKIEVVVIKSGKAKDSGSPFRKMKPQEKKEFQKIIDEMYERFLNIVVESRKKVLTREQIKLLADGRVFTGKQAYQHKLVDALGYLEDAVTKAEELAGIKDTKVIRYKKPKGVLESAFRIEKTETDLAQLRKILFQNSTSRFMYLWLPGAE